MYEDFVATDRWTSEKLHCVWKGTVVAIATRHADATDIRFAVNGKPLWIAMPNLAWVEHKRRNGKVITDYLAAQAAGRYLKQAIESGYDNGREMYTMTVDEVLREVKTVMEEVGNTANLPSLPVVEPRRSSWGIRLQTTRRAANCRRVRLVSTGPQTLMGYHAVNKYLTNRRQFLASAAAFPFALRALASPIPGNPRWILLGTGTDKGIFRAAWNAETGDLSRIEAAAATQHPSFLAMHPRQPILYAVNEVPSGDGALCSFRLDPAKATLTPLERVSSEGNGPCYVSVDATGRSAFVANYGGGSLAAFGLGAGGSLRSAGLFDCHGNAACGVLGPNKERQEAAHMHCALISPDNRFVLACNLGEDAIEIFRIHPGAAKPAEAPVRFAARAGSGPRHLAFHPNGLWLYCIHELDCTIDLYDWNVNNGAAAPVLRKDSVISTLASPAALPGSTACEIVVSPDGRFVYGNTRGENSLVVYRVNPSTGLLTEQQRVFSGGGLTRHFAFDPSHRWLLCANQGTSTVTVFAHDPATGRLAEKPKSFPIDTPMFVQFV